MPTMKQWLIGAGRRCSPLLLAKMNSGLNYLEAGRWFASHGFSTSGDARDRSELFDRAADDISELRVAYLEFGVWRGDSIREWSRLLRHPQSTLHGFDSFEGLPEDWNLLTERGKFSTQGIIPQVDDPRVGFSKGWFEDTLENYVVPDHDVLFLMLDADVYSSTKTVLDRFKGAMVPGTYVYFDEFNDRNHELRAFDELVRETGMQFRLVGADRTLLHVLFQRVES
jgi:hypothetical protein